MGKDKFIFQHIREDGSKVELETLEHAIPDILEEFAHFLKGCGFCLDGKVIDMIEVDNE